MATKRNMRVQVDRLALIAAIERKQNQCRKDYERKGHKHVVEIQKWKAEKVSEMRKEAALLTKRANKLNATSAQAIKKSLDENTRSSSYYLKNVDGGALYPPREREGNQLQGFETILRMLRMSKTASVSLNEEQFRAYMDGCPINQR